MVTGRVQGVGFRYFVKEKALDCNLTGWVKNLPNGHVEIEAEGDEKDLTSFLDYLKIGTGYSRTDRLKHAEIKPLANFTDFRIRY